MHFRWAGRTILGILVLIPTSVGAQWGDWDNRGYRTQIDALGSTTVESLSIPVLGVELRALTPNFGDSRDGGTRTHEGQDIMAPQGTPVVTPTDAVVTRTGDGSGSGLYVRTANPGGESFVYMHLSRIAEGITPGKILVRGDILGYVGNTGNASGAAPHLHFEIWRDGVAQDPYPRLKEVFASPQVAQNNPTTATSTGEKLVYGESNNDIVALQKFLIASGSGTARTRLKNSGATGYFGPVTKAALLEYQQSVSLPASGVVDTDTYAKIFATQNSGAPQADVPVLVTFVFTRDLEVGSVGEDVQALQVFLNTHGVLVAQSGVGSPGQETNFFGSLTREALARYQAAQNISPAAGYFGPITRAHLSKTAVR